MGRQADEKLPDTEARRGPLFFESADGRLIHARG
jgi:hypothetical protein